jgi:hypothetical protein
MLNYIKMLPNNSSILIHLATLFEKRLINVTQTQLI